jgi:hypothetical protein
MDTHLIISLFHVLFVVPMFFLIAFFRSDIPDGIFQCLLGLGLFIGIYHGYKAVVRYAANSQYLWVNLIHILFVAPLLVYIGYNQKQTPRWAYEVCILVGSAALGYHTYSLVKMANVVETK